MADAEVAPKGKAVFRIGPLSKSTTRFDPVTFRTLLAFRYLSEPSESKWTQDVLAEKSRISKGFLSDLENNNRSIGADRLLDLARVLGVSLDYLMKGETPERAEKQIVISPRLAEFAKQKPLPFTTALLLLEMSRQIIAHRSTTKSDDPEDFNWEKFYNAVKDFLP